jgi:predicted transcriptional regulator
MIALPNDAHSVRRYMATPVLTVRSSSGLACVDRLLREHQVSALVVEQDSSTPVGVISRTDLLRVATTAPAYKQRRTLTLPDDKSARSVMTGEIVTAHVDQDLSGVAQLMSSRGIHRVFTTDDEKIVGVVATCDVMKAIVDQRLGTPIGEAMTPQVVSVQGRESMALAVERLLSSHIHGLVILSGAYPVGVIDVSDVLLAKYWADSAKVQDWMNPRVLMLPIETPLNRAAEHALAMDARHVVVMGRRGNVEGIVTGADFARVYGRSNGHN